MKKLVKRSNNIKKIFYILITLFLVTFVLRSAYEIYFSYNDITISYYTGNTNHSSYEMDTASRKHSNIATDKISQKDFSGHEITIDQKYEKTANLSSNTTDFKNDNQQLRQVIEDNNAVIQMENLSGLEGNQSLVLTIGVVPENFDNIVENLNEIGEIRNFSVNKIDKTSEYMNLMAEQDTLKKTRDSYIEIKNKGGNIQDLLLLEEKILEVEEKLQDLGVDIGIFSSEYSFCTVNFTLDEVVKQVVSVRFMLTCVKRSFFWTTMLFAIILLWIFIVLAAIAVLLAIYNYIRQANAKDYEDNEEEIKERTKGKTKEKMKEDIGKEK